MSHKSVLTGGLALIFLLGGIAPIQAIDCLVVEHCLDPTIIDNERLHQLLTDLFSEASLSPMMIDGPVEYHVTHIESRGWSGNVHITGLLRHSEMSLHAVTSIHKGWFWDSAELLYLSTEEAMSPNLFSDISRALSYFLAPELEKRTLVIVECADCFTLPEGPKYQTWKYFNESFLQEFIVALDEDERGSVTFEILSDSNRHLTATDVEKKTSS